MTKLAPDLVSTAKAAELIGCHYRTIHRLVESGQLIPALKLPGKTGSYLFFRSDIESLASDQGALS